MSYRPPKDLDEQARQARAKLTAHRGMATWGEKLVPLGDFREAAAGSGLTLSPEEREAAVRSRTAPLADPTPVEGPWSRIAVFGGVYNNHLALRSCWRTPPAGAPRRSTAWATSAASAPTPRRSGRCSPKGACWRSRGTTRSRSPPAARTATAATPIRATTTSPASPTATPSGTARRTSRPGWGALPRRRRVRVGDRELLLVHGSPRRINEFLFQSTSPVPFLEVLLDQNRCDGILATHTGLHWHRRLPSGRDVVNVGVIGRPANDGNTHVWYAMLEARDGRPRGRAACRSPTTTRRWPPRCAPRGCPRSSSRRS